MKGLIFVNPFLVPKESIHQAERLKEEFNKRGVKVEIISDGYLRVVADGNGAKIDIPQSDFAIYLDKDKYLSELLSKSGIRLFNKHQSVRVCDDKATTYLALMGQGIKIPKTIFGALCYDKGLPLNENATLKIAGQLGYPVIVKESFGSMGKGVYKADTNEQLLAVMEKIKTKPHLFQEYLSYQKGVDIRVIVIGGKTVAVMKRTNENDFRSNIAQGGKGEKFDIPFNFKQTAENCAKILDLDYCGVDLIYGNDGEPVLCEVNSNAFIKGIEEVTGINVAGLYADYIIKTIEK